MELTQQSIDQIARAISQRSKQLEFKPEFTTETVTKNDVVMTYGRRSRKFSTRFHITRDQAFELQCEFGYHPCGYGLHMLTYNEEGTTWECSDNSD